MIPRYDFTSGFKTSVSDNEVWKGDVTHLLNNSVQIYTDNTKLNGAVGIGIFSESVGIGQSVRLPDHCTVRLELLGTERSPSEKSPYFLIARWLPGF